MNQFISEEEATCPFCLYFFENCCRCTQCDIRICGQHIPVSEHLLVTCPRCQANNSFVADNAYQARVDQRETTCDRCEMKCTWLDMRKHSKLCEARSTILQETIECTHPGCGDLVPLSSLGSHAEQHYASFQETIDAQKQRQSDVLAEIALFCRARAQRANREDS